MADKDIRIGRFRCFVDITADLIERFPVDHGRHQCVEVAGRADLDPFDLHQQFIFYFAPDARRDVRPGCCGALLPGQFERTPDQ